MSLRVRAYNLLLAGKFFLHEVIVTPLFANRNDDASRLREAKKIRKRIDPACGKRCECSVSPSQENRGLDLHDSRRCNPVSGGANGGAIKINYI